MKQSQQPRSASPRLSTSGTAIVNVTTQYSPKPDGGTIVQYSFKLWDAPVPSRRYSADTGYIDTRDDIVRLMFGQVGVVDPSLRTLLVVRMFPDPARRLLNAVADFMPRVREFARTNEISVPRLSEIRQEPAHVVVVDANVTAVGFTGREAEIDFYHVGAMALRRAADQNHGNTLEVDAVVRVDTSTALLCSMLDLLEKLRDSLPPEVILPGEVQ